MPLRRLLFALALAATPTLVHAESGRVIGDSIGVGISWAAKIPSTAKNSVAIYSGAIMEQLRQAQHGETVFLSLGTNDAVGGALDVKAKVTQIVAEADSLGVKLVWMGPPCVLKPWEQYSRKLDGILREQLAGTSATYVSLQDAQFCSPTVHAPEGVHFNMAGYDLMWQKAAAAVNFPVVVAAASAPRAAAPEGRQHHVHRKHRKRRAAADATPTTPAAPN
jgi:hypothetical protein